MTGVGWAIAARIKPACHESSLPALEAQCKGLGRCVCVGGGCLGQHALTSSLGACCLAGAKEAGAAGS